jgi:2,3-bisphosphoglycerate-dependent phosphoglycerate mutase
VTAWNKERRFQGGMDIALDDEGVQQAALLGRHFQSHETRPDVLIASDLGRAIATAQPIADHFALNILIEPLWRERHYGDFEGKNHQELEARYPREFAQWKARDLHGSFPGGGESVAVFHARVASALAGVERLFSPSVRRVVVLTHGGVLGCAYRIALGLPPDDPIRVPIANTSINRLFLDESGETARWGIRSWGELLHLD